MPKLPGGRFRDTRQATSPMFDIRIGVLKDAPYDVAFHCGELFTTMEPEVAEQVGMQFLNAAKSSRLVRAKAKGEIVLGHS